jgi:hypothetical protein
MNSGICGKYRVNGRGWNTKNKFFVIMVSISLHKCVVSSALYANAFSPRFFYIGFCLFGNYDVSGLYIR